MTRSEVLAAAGQAVADRGLNYGQPEDNFERIARRWNAHLKNRGLLAHSYGVEASDVAIMMADVKLARLANDPAHADSWVDVAGYAACGAEVAQPRAGVGEQFGFYVGETVNFRRCRVGDNPGEVIGFSEDRVLVQWPSGVRNLHSSGRLRHGP